MAVALAGYRILVVEDLYLIAVTVCEALQQAGAEVVGPYPSCQQSLAVIEKERVDVAILDIALTDGTVFPVARKLAHSGTPFMFLTGYDSHGVPGEFPSAPHMIKPVHLDELCQRVAMLVTEPAAQPSR